MRPYSELPPEVPAKDSPFRQAIIEALSEAD
jgi:hypothetical protein